MLQFVCIEIFTNAKAPRICIQHAQLQRIYIHLATYCSINLRGNNIENS